MIGAITVLPAIAFLYCAARSGVWRAIVWVLLPCVLLLPNYYTWKLSGIPRFDFHNYALLAAAGLVWLKSSACDRKLHALDWMIVLLLVLITNSEFENRGFAEARNVATLSVMGLGAPYLIGRLVVRDERTCAALIASLVLVGAVIGSAGPYEARLGVDPFDSWIRRLWPNAVPWDGALYRAGIRRVAGPFAHPICHGFFFSLSAPLALWLVRFRLTSGTKLRAWLVGAQLLGLLLSVSRGPIVGVLVALWIFGFGLARKRRRWLGVSVLALLFTVVLKFDDVRDYVTVTRGEARTHEQETAAYRNEMLEAYLEVVDERPWIGYGKDQIPIVKGLKSVDNQYLFLALTHGLPAAYLFLALMILPALTGARRLLQRGLLDSRAALHWAILAVLLGATLTQVTVFSGTQTTQVLFLLEGMAVGLLLPGGLRVDALE